MSVSGLRDTKPSYGLSMFPPAWQVVERLNKLALPIIALAVAVALPGADAFCISCATCIAGAVASGGAVGPFCLLACAGCGITWSTPVF